MPQELFWLTIVSLKHFLHRVFINGELQDIVFEVACRRARSRMNMCKFRRTYKKNLAKIGTVKYVIDSYKLFSFYLFSCYDQDCYFDKIWSSSKPGVFSFVFLSLKLSGNTAEKAEYPTPAPASTAAPSQALYVITINISTYPTNTCSVWRNVCRMCILLFHLVLKKVIKWEQLLAMIIKTRKQRMFSLYFVLFHTPCNPALAASLFGRFVWCACDLDDLAI